VRAKRGVVVGGGEVLQPIFYALACEGLMRERVEAGRLYYCTADGDYEEREVPLDQPARDTAQRVVDIIGAALHEGFLPAAPADGACGWCDYFSVCGPYEEIRVRRKPRGRLEDLFELRGME
jgi:CRISPR/Cas system-associated exonuclease Cas4 (RecB family)